MSESTMASSSSQQNTEFRSQDFAKMLVHKFYKSPLVASGPDFVKIGEESSQHLGMSKVAWLDFLNGSFEKNYLNLEQDFSQNQQKESETKNFDSDIIEKLLDKNLTHVCYSIFGYLDSSSFTNCQSVCKKWKKFIDHYFFEVKKGKKWLKRKLTSNFFEPDFILRSTEVPLFANVPLNIHTIIAIEVNFATVCIAYVAKIGAQSNEGNDDYHLFLARLDFETFQTIWNIGLITFFTAESVVSAVKTTKMQINKNRIFTFFDNGSKTFLMMVDRENGSILSNFRVMPHINTYWINNMIAYDDK